MSALALLETSVAVNVFHPADRTLVIPPFTYSLIPDLDGWIAKSDQYLLRVCSTSPEAEPSHFCQAVRSVLRRMRDNPQPLTSLFPGSRPRLYRLEREAGGWTWHLVGQDLADTGAKARTCNWGIREFRRAFM